MSPQNLLDGGLGHRNLICHALDLIQIGLHTRHVAVGLPGNILERLLF